MRLRSSVNRMSSGPKYNVWERKRLYCCPLTIPTSWKSINFSRMKRSSLLRWSMFVWARWGSSWNKDKLITSRSRTNKLPKSWTASLKQSTTFILWALSTETSNPKTSLFKTEKNWANSRLPTLDWEQSLNSGPQQPPVSAAPTSSWHQKSSGITLIPKLLTYGHARSLCTCSKRNPIPFMKLECPTKILRKKSRISYFHRLKM